MSHTPVRTPTSTDDKVLWVVIAFCLLASVGLVLLAGLTDHWFPPMLIAMLLGIAVAALTYRYLGGTGAAEFRVGALKVAGSAALLIGSVYLANQGLEKQLGSASIRLVAITSARDHAISQQTKLQETLDQRMEQLRTIQVNANTDLLDKVRRVAVGTPTADTLVRMAKHGEGPFGTLINKMSVRLSVIALPPGHFSICNDLGLSERTVTIVNTQGGTQVSGQQTGVIEDAYCASDRKFDIQIGCADGHVLFPDDITCSSSGDVRWQGARHFPAATADIYRE